MKIKMVDLHRQYQLYKKEIDDAIAQVIASCSFTGNQDNPFVKNFEGNFSQYIGSKYCVACANGTDAIEILLRAMGIGYGDEVIVPAISWIATSEAVTNIGARPVFVDVEPDYYGINWKLIEEKITVTTKAIIPVHLYGHPADMNSIVKVAKKHNLLVLEDCAQAHGAEIDGKKVGTFGEAASFSFFPGKNLGAFGDAGGMVTNNSDIAKTARMISQHGQSGQKHAHLIEGRNSMMDGIQAAILDVKLTYLDHWTELRNLHAKKYSKLLEGFNVDIPKVRAHFKHVYHLFVIRTQRRAEFIKNLNENGISAAIQYPKALPFITAYESYGHIAKDFPVASVLQNEVMSLPMFPELQDDEIKYVVRVMKNGFGQHT